MIGKYKNIIIVLVIVILGFVAYSFLKPADSTETLLSTTEKQDSTQILGDEISSAINQINSLKLDRGVLDDPVVKNLVDHSKPIVSEPVGRKNPFAPIGQDSGNSATSTISSTSTSTSNLKINTATSTTGTTSQKTSTSTAAH